MISPDTTRSLTDFTQALWRYRWRFVGCAFMVAALLLALGLVLPRKYRGEALFERRTDMVLAEIVNRGASHSYQDPRQTVTEELAGQVAIEQVITELQPLLSKHYRYFDKQMVAAEMARRIIVKSEITSNSVDRVRISYVADDPAVAQAVVNKLVSNYLARTRQQLEERLRETESFFESEVARTKQVIAQLEDRKVAFEIEHAGLLPDNPYGVAALQAQVQEQLLTAQQDRDAAHLRVAGLEKALDDTPQTTPLVVKQRNPELTRIEDKLREMRGQLESYLNQYRMTDRHPDVIQIQSEIELATQTLAGTEREIVTQVSTSANPKYSELDLQLTHARSQLQAHEQRCNLLQKQIEQLDASTADLFAVRSEYSRLERDMADAQRQLAFWDDNRRRVGMAMTAETGNRGIRLDFIKPCEKLVLPVSPNLWQLLMLAIGAGLTAGGVAVFLRQRADESFSDGEELSAALELPLFGSVSEIISSRQRNLRRVRDLVLFPCTATVMLLLLGVLAGMLYLSLQRPDTYDKVRSDPAGAIAPLARTPVLSIVQPSDGE